MKNMQYRLTKSTICRTSVGIWYPFAPPDPRSTHEPRQPTAGPMKSSLPVVLNTLSAMNDKIAAQFGPGEPGKYKLSWRSSGVVVLIVMKAENTKCSANCEVS